VLGRAITQAVSRWLPTAAARVQARVWSSGICGGHSGAGAGFLRVLRFSLPVFIPPNYPSSPSPGADTMGQLMADPVWTPTPTMGIFNKSYSCVNTLIIGRQQFRKKYIIKGN
jgi:hypothetical protein